MALKKLMKKKPSLDSVSQDGNPTIGYVVKSASDLPKFHKAIWQEDFNKVSQMIKKVDINARDKELRTPLHLASARLNEPILKLLCHYTPDVDAQDRERMTALFKAAEAASSNAVNILLQARANPNISSRDGDTPLHVSSQSNDDKSVKLLIGHNANINTPNAKGLTPLHLAAQAGHANLVELFAKEGAKLNVLCGESQTPLMSAAEYGRMQVVRCLLELRVETEIKNRQGWKAVDLAQINGHNQCKSLIEDEVRRRAPRHLPSLDTQPGLFSEKPSLGVPAQDVPSSSQVSDVSEEVSARDVHSGSEDDSISFEPSMPKISLKPALYKQVTSPSDETMSPNKQELETDSDSKSQYDPPARISPVHSSPEVERGATLDISTIPLDLSTPAISREKTKAVGVQLSSTPILNPSLPTLPQDSQLSDDTEGSDTSISGNNIYVPTFNLLSPLSEVPESSHTLPRDLLTAIYPTQNISTEIQTEELAKRSQLSNEDFTDSEEVRPPSPNPTRPQHHVLATSPLQSAASTEKEVNEEDKKPDESTSDFDSDQEVVPDKIGNPIYNILSLDDESSEKQEDNATVSETSYIDIKSPKEDKIDSEIISPKLYVPKSARTLPSPPLPRSRPSEHRDKSIDLIQLGVEESSEPKPSSSLPVNDSTTIPLDFPEIQTPTPIVDNSMLQTVFKTVSKFESLSRIAEQDVSVFTSQQKEVNSPLLPLLLESKTPDSSKFNPQTVDADEKVQTGFELLEIDQPLSSTIHPDPLAAKTLTTPVTQLGTPTNPLGTPANPLGTPANPLGTPANPLGTPANPLGTDKASSQLSEFDISLSSASEAGNLGLVPHLEGIASDISSCDDPPLPSHAPTLWHTTLSPNRSVSSILKQTTTQETEPVFQPDEPRTPISLNTIPAIQLTDSKSLYTLTQQLSRLQSEKEGFEGRLKLADLNASKLSNALEEVEVNCSELQAERSRLVEAQHSSDLLIRKLQFELQQKSSVNLEESEMMKQLGEKVTRLETQLVGETEAHTNEEVRRRELDLQLQFSQSTGVQMSNRVNELCSQLTQCQSALSDLKQNYSQSVSNHETLKKGYDTVVAQKDGLQSEVSKLESHVNVCTMDIEKLRTEQRLVSEELRRKEGKIEDLQTSILQHSDQASSLLQGKVESLREVERQAGVERMALELQLVSANAESSKLKGDMVRAEEKVSALEREVQGLEDRLKQSSAEMEQVRKSSNASERASQSSASVLLAEKELLERENLSSRQQIKGVQAKVDILEQQLVEKSGELKHTQSLLAERGNLVTILQRDVDHNAMLLASTGEKLKLEERNSAGASKQLEQTASLLEASKQEVSQLRSQLEQSRHELSEHKSLTERLESRHQTDALQRQSELSETRASAEEERRGLLQEVAVLREKSSLLQQQLLESQSTARECQEEVTTSRGECSLLMQSLKQEQLGYQQLQAENTRLQEERSNSISELAGLQNSISILQLEKSALNKEVENQQVANRELTLRVNESAKEANAIAQARGSVESQLRFAESEKLELQANYDKQSLYIDSLKNELTAARKERTGNDAALFDMNDKKLRLEEELVGLREEKSHALMEATECKLMWETEVKSRSKLGMKILQLEKNREDSEGLLKTEREEKVKVSGAVRELENKVQFLTDANNRVEEQNRNLGVELKSYKKRIKDFELREHRFPDIKSELSKERTVFENTLSSIRDQLSQSRESAACLKSNNTGLKAQLSTTARQLDEVQTQLTRLRSEKGEESKAYLQLKVEQQKLREELLKSQHCCSQKERLYLTTKETEMQNRQDFNHKLQVLNAHLLEQTQAQELLDRSKREGEMLLIQELEKKTSQLESELMLAKRNNMGDVWRDQDYSHNRYNRSYLQKDSSKLRDNKYKDPIQDIHSSYHVPDSMFSIPQVSLLPGDSLGSFLPTYEPATPQPYHIPSASSARGSKWLDALDSKIADQLSLAESVNISSAEPTLLSRNNDPHLTAIFHNYEV